MYTAMGGNFKAFVLAECSLFFYGNTGIYNIDVGVLGLQMYHALQMIARRLQKSRINRLALRFRHFCQLDLRLRQFQADQLGTVVRRPEVLETTALGAAYLAGLGEGVWSSLEEISKSWSAAAEFEPSMSRSMTGAQFAGR